MDLDISKPYPELFLATRIIELTNYALVGMQSFEAYSSCRVCMSVLQRAFLCDGNELTNEIAMQLQLDILIPLNWLDFRFKALLSS